MRWFVFSPSFIGALHMLSLMVWSIQWLQDGSQYINQDVDKVKHPTYCQVPLVCITSSLPKIHSVTEVTGKENAECGFLSIYMIHDSSNCLQGTVTVSWTQLANLVLEFELRPATEHFSSVAMSFISQAWPTKRVDKTALQPALWAVLAPCWTEVSLWTALCVFWVIWNS